MIESGYANHIGFNERARIVESAGHYWVAENCAEGYFSAESLIRAWLTSPGHKENMLDLNAKRAGLAYVNGYACLIVCD